MKKNTIYNLIIIFFFCLFNTNMTAQTKGLYVNDFKFIVGDIIEENKLLTYAQDSGFNYLILYNLYHIHNNIFDITDSISALPLSTFISKAKNDYGISEVAGVGETYNSFNNIHEYNLDHINTPDERIDIYNLEHEFWNSSSTGPGGYYCTTYLTPNGITCDTAGAFSFILPELCKIDSLCDEYDWLSSEIYIGKPTNLQCAKLAICADRVLVHFYRSSDVYGNGNSIYNYKKYRMEALTDSVSDIIIMPIFAGCDNFMGDWLLTHPEGQAYDTWWYGLNSYNDETDPWVDKITLAGYVWYRYTCMYDIFLAFEDIGFRGSLLNGDILLKWDITDYATEGQLQLLKSYNLKNWNTILEQSIRIDNESITYQYEDTPSNPNTHYYKLKFTSINGKSKESVVLSFNPTESPIKIYPLPSNGNITIDGLKGNPYKLKLYDIHGKQITIPNLIGNNLNIKGIASGVYFLQFAKEDQTTIIKRIVIE